MTTAGLGGLGRAPGWVGAPWALRGAGSGAIVHQLRCAVMHTCGIVSRAIVRINQQRYAVMNTCVASANPSLRTSPRRSSSPEAERRAACNQRPRVAGTWAAASNA